MQHDIKVVMISILSLIFINSAYAKSNYTVSCPEKIATTQNTPDVYPGWRLITAQQPSYYLSGVTLFSGKPEEMASLKPDSVNSTKAIWTFSANEVIYIVCEYNQTSIQLTKALAAHTTSCTVRYDQNVRSSAGGYIPKQILCT